MFELGIFDLFWDVFCFRMSFQLDDKGHERKLKERVGLAPFFPRPLLLLFLRGQPPFSYPSSECLVYSRSCRQLPFLMDSCTFPRPLVPPSVDIIYSGSFRGAYAHILFLCTVPCFQVPFFTPHIPLFENMFKESNKQMEC